jgi:hypothetical protein
MPQDQWKENERQPVMVKERECERYLRTFQAFVFLKLNPKSKKLENPGYLPCITPKKAFLSFNIPLLLAPRD